jgi:hypothetical protein
MRFLSKIIGYFYHWMNFLQDVKKILLSSRQFLMFFLMVFIFLGCFDVFHFIKINPDNSLDIKYRLLISKILMGMGDAKKSNEFYKDYQQFFDTVQNQRIIENYQFKEIDNMYNQGFLVSFKVKNQNNLNKIENLQQKEIFQLLNIIPQLKGKQMILNALKNKKEQVQENKKQENIKTQESNKNDEREKIESEENSLENIQKKESEEVNQETELEEDLSNQKKEEDNSLEKNEYKKSPNSFEDAFGVAILSSVTYSLVIKGKEILDAKIVRITDNNESPLNVDKLDDKEYIIYFPLILILLDKENNYKIIINFK